MMQKNSKISSVIFDMDGTLLDSSYAMTCSVNHVRESLGLEPIQKEFLEFHINEPDQNLPMIFYGTTEYDPCHKELFTKHYLENANLHVKPYDGAKELLESLHVKGMHLSIATNASDYFAKNMLEYQGFLDFFHMVLGSNNVPASKPNPDMIDAIITQSGIPKEETILVGDSVKDEQAAFNAGIDFVFVQWGYGKSYDERSIQCNHMEKLHNIIENTN